MSFIKTFIALAIIALPFTSNTISASEPLSAGNAIPQNISLQNQSGDNVQLNDLTGSNGMILFFYRSADWCPYCQAQIIDMRNKIETYQKAGFNIVGVSYDSVAKLAKFDAKHKTGITLLSDTNSETIKTFGIFDDSHREGSFAYGVAKPHVYVVDANGVIQAVLAEDSYKKRPQIDAIMEAVYAFKEK